MKETNNIIKVLVRDMQIGETYLDEKTNIILGKLEIKEIIGRGGTGWEPYFFLEFNDGEKKTTRESQDWQIAYIQQQ
jgi:hypothetical protein